MLLYMQAATNQVYSLDFLAFIFGHNKRFHFAGLIAKNGREERKCFAFGLTRIFTSTYFKCGGLIWHTLRWMLRFNIRGHLAFQHKGSRLSDRAPMSCHTFDTARVLTRKSFIAPPTFNMLIKKSQSKIPSINIRAASSRHYLSDR